MNDEADQNNSPKKTKHPKSTECSKAPKSMLSNYFCKWKTTTMI